MNSVVPVSRLVWSGFWFRSLVDFRDLSTRHCCYRHRGHRLDRLLDLRGLRVRHDSNSSCDFRRFCRFCCSRWFSWEAFLGIRSQRRVCVDSQWPKTCTKFKKLWKNFKKFFFFLFEPTYFWERIFKCSSRTIVTVAFHGVVELVLDDCAALWSFWVIWNFLGIQL